MVWDPLVTSPPPLVRRTISLAVPRNQSLDYLVHFCALLQLLRDWTKRGGCLICKLFKSEGTKVSTNSLIYVTGTGDDTVVSSTWV